MEQLELYNNVQVLKNSDKYFIFACDEQEGRRVYKIAHHNNDKLLKEVYRIKKLITVYPSLSARMPIVYRNGVLENGIHRGKGYFVQHHFAGCTFSKYVQNSSVSPDQLRLIIKNIIQTLLDIAAEHTINSTYDQKSGQFLKEAILYEYEQFHALNNIDFLVGMPAVIINGQEYPPLIKLLEKIFSSLEFNALNNMSSFISSLGHWNFHGDNIILENLSNVADFKVIDPDIKIEECDPMFGIARFLYSFPHDTADYEQYAIHSSFFAKVPTACEELRITYLWPQTVYQNYSALFHSICADGPFHINELDKRLGDQNLLFRLKLCELFCLFRGVCANYDEEVEFVNGKVDEFRNKSIYLYLQTLMFANKLANNLI